MVPKTVNENKRSRTTTKPATKKQKKAANEATKKQKTAALATPEVMPPIHEDMEFEGAPEPQPVQPKPRGRSRKISEQPKSSSIISCTYRDNFSGNLAPASSTGVDWSTCSSMARKTRTMDLASFAEDNDTRVLHQNFKGGKMLVYQDYSKGIIVLDSKKERARVKRKPLVSLYIISCITKIPNIEFFVLIGTKYGFWDSNCESGVGATCGANGGVGRVVYPS